MSNLDIEVDIDSWDRCRRNIGSGNGAGADPVAKPGGGTRTGSSPSSGMTGSGGTNAATGVGGRGESS